MYQFRLLYTLFIHKCEATRRTSLGTLSVSRSLSMHAAWMCISVCVCLCVRCAAHIEQFHRKIFFFMLYFSFLFFVHI